MILDGDKKQQENIKQYVLKLIEELKPDVDERKPIYKLRRDMFEGKHNEYTNVVGLSKKRQEGHVLPVFNYVRRMADKLYQSITNYPPRFKMVGEDESNDIEVARAEGGEDFIRDVLYSNDFYETTFKDATMIQVRDGDFAIKCTAEINDRTGEKEIKISSVGDMEKLYVLWDDSAGKTYSAVMYVDEWTFPKIQREFPNIDITKFTPSNARDESGSSRGQHGDEYGTTTPASTTREMVPSGKTKVPKLQIIDFWGWVAMEGKPVMVNAVIIGKGEESQLVQLAKTDYKYNPYIIGKSNRNPGKPWSSAFIDPIFDANIELNDRTGEVADLIRTGANQKYVVVNMPDFDPGSVKPGTGQVVFIEGEDADFRPLDTNINTFPAETYLNSVLEHIFSLALPKIALASGNAPYTGRLGAIQYQSVTDIVTDYRIAWNKVLKELFNMIQSYGIAYYPELREVFTVSVEPTPGVYMDAGVKQRKVEFDWDNPLPLSRSDSVVDSATLYDRGAIPLSVFIEQAGFKDPQRMIKRIVKERQDPDLAPIVIKSAEQLNSGVTRASIQANEMQMEAQGNMMDPNQMPPQQGTGSSFTPPIMHQNQNQGDRRGISSAKGAPQSGQVSQAGAVRRVQQNTNARGGL